MMSQLLVPNGFWIAGGVWGSECIEMRYEIYIPKVML